MTDADDAFLLTTPAGRARTPATAADRAVAVRGAAVAAALAALTGIGPAHAHDPGDEALPPLPGWRVGAALAVGASAADARWPTATWPGAGTLGSAPRDTRGLALEHATLDAAWRLRPGLGVHVAAGLHAGDAAHLEAARVQWRGPWADGEWQATAGRDTVRLGAVIDGAGQFDTFGQVPAAKRAVLNEMWTDDGLQAAWLGGGEGALRRVEAGLWRGKAFPGGPGGPAGLSLRGHWGWGHHDLQLFAARLATAARGAAAQTAGRVGHVHGSLDCRDGLAQRVCTDARVTVWGLSLSGESADGGWAWRAAGLGRREHGALYGTDGEASLRSTVAGGWVDLDWRFAPRWQASARAERLVPTHRLEGAGAGTLARQAGMLDAGPVRRATLALTHRPEDLPAWVGRGRWAVSAEAGQERSPAGTVNHLMIRLRWQDPTLLEGR